MMLQKLMLNSRAFGAVSKVLILEPHADGHHGPYLQWMAIGLAERGFEVTIVTFSETMVHPSMQALANAIPNASGGSLSLMDAGAPIDFPSGAAGGTTGLVVRERTYWRLFRAWYKAYAGSVRPDVVFLPYLDYCLYAIGLLGSPFGNCPWVGLAMRPSFHYSAMGVRAPQPALAGVKKMLFFRVIHNRYLRQLLTIDEPLASYLVDTLQVSGKASFFPEPAELGELPAPDEAKRKFGMDPEHKLILLYGAVTSRKGVIELLRALAAPCFPPTVDVLLAGKVTETGIGELLSESWVHVLQKDGRLKVIDRFIEAVEEPALFAAADIVWAGYRGHYNSSGLLIQAASAGRPVLACDEGVLGWQTERHGLGLVVNPADSAEVTLAAHTLLKNQTESEANAKRADTWWPPSFSEAQDALARALTEI